MENEMKYIKMFEIRRRDNIDFEDPEELKKLQDEWQKFEDNVPWDFDYFWNKISAYYLDYTNRYRDPEGETSIVLNSHETVGNKILSKSIDWQKRNGYIEVSIVTGGASGGSCWDTGDDDGAQPFDTYNRASYDGNLKPFLEHILYGIFGKIQNPAGIGDAKRLVNDLGKNLSKNGVIESDYTDYEYYGNYTNYDTIRISLWNLYKFIAKNDGF